MSKHPESASVRSLTVAGHGEIHAKPDVTWIRLGITSHGQSAQAAASANAERMTAVIERMKQLGISEKKLQTGGLNLQPVIQQTEGPDKGQIVGYIVENYLTVRAPVDKAGEIFDAGLAAGADQSSHMVFGLQDEAALRDKALELAIQAARHEAKIVASAAGIRVGDPCRIEITGNGTPVVRGALEKTSSVATPVLPGVLTVVAHVTMVFEYARE